MTKNRIDFLDEMEYLDGISIVDTNAVILFSAKFNTSFNTDYAEGHDIRGKTLYEVFKNIDVKNSTLVKSMALGVPIYKKKQQILNPVGETIYTRNISLPIKSNGKIVGAIELSRDITENNKTLTGPLLIDSAYFEARNILKKHFGPNQAKYSLKDIISKDPTINEIKYIIRKISSSSSPVFIHGETGTGKELFAHAIHSESVRKDGPFIAQNCAAIPENLLESLLFGTTKGSYTGAGDNAGLIELANGGTLFLDEIHSMPLPLQAKLLRFLQDGCIRRLGDKTEVKTDVRIISASNVSPKECLERGLLRYDIYYRLCVLEFLIPPLRDRKEDIGILLNYFISEYNQVLGKNVKTLSEEVLNIFHNYNWPGNVRELEHIIEYAMNIIDDAEETIEYQHVEQRINPFNGSKIKNKQIAIVPLAKAVDKVERELIELAISQTEGNVSKAARLLKIPRQTLQKKITKYDLG